MPQIIIIAIFILAGMRFVVFYVSLASQFGFKIHMK